MHHSQTTMLDDRPPISLCVLGSSSGGNSSVVRLAGVSPQDDAYFAIDLGFSPRKTRSLLSSISLCVESLAGVLLTHLDADHWHTGWQAALPDRCPLHMHPRHRARADRMGATFRTTHILERETRLSARATLRWTLNPHDDLGSVAYRIDHESGASIGYATDLGQAHSGLVSLLRGVDVLAIESNYCPRMQAESDRPDFLKRRVMGGAGHLSNEQSASLVRAIAPKQSVVLLHLSRQCNTHERALHSHLGAHHRVIVASHDTPTGWIDTTSPPRAPELVTLPSTLRAQGLLFESHASSRINRD